MEENKEIKNENNQQNLIPYKKNNGLVIALVTNNGKKR